MLNFRGVPPIAKSLIPIGSMVIFTNLEKDQASTIDHTFSARSIEMFLKSVFESTKGRSILTHLFPWKDPWDWYI